MQRSIMVRVSQADRLLCNRQFSVFTMRQPKSILKTVKFFILYGFLLPMGVLIFLGALQDMYMHPMLLFDMQFTFIKFYLFLWVARIGVVALMAHGIWPFSIKRLYETKGQPLYKMDLYWDDDGLSIYDKYQDMLYKWDAFIGFIELKDFIVLNVEYGYNFLIPRRCFDSAQYADVLALLKRGQSMRASINKH